VTTVLLVEDDAMFRASVARDLNEQGLEVVLADSVPSALTILRNRHIDVLLTDLRMGEEDGIDLIKKASLRQPLPRTILMSAYATAKDQQVAQDLGVMEVLCKPFTVKELRRAITRALEAGFQGTVHGLSLVDMLQMFHANRRSVSIHVTGDQPALINVQAGDVVHAETGSERGEEALRRILSRPSGTIRTTPLTHHEQTIERGFDGLLLDCLRQNDESSRTTSDPGGADDDFGFDDWVESDATPPRRGVKPMGAIDESCKKVATEVDGAIACGVVDLDTGMVLGLHNTAQYSQTLNEVVAAAAVELFRGASVSRIEKLVREHRGVPENGEHYFMDIQITSTNTLHFIRALKAGRAAIVLVCGRDTNVGMGWAQLRAAVPEVEPHIP
jgi:CheY-like chemotaxis protein